MGGGAKTSRATYFIRLGALIISSHAAQSPFHFSQWASNDEALSVFHSLIHKRLRVSSNTAPLPRQALLTRLRGLTSTLGHVYKISAWDLAAGFPVSAGLLFPNFPIFLSHLLPPSCGLSRLFVRAASIFGRPCAGIGRGSVLSLTCSPLSGFKSIVSSFS